MPVNPNGLVTLSRKPPAGNNRNPGIGRYPSVNEGPRRARSLLTARGLRAHRAGGPYAAESSANSQTPPI